jgi:hypothetical protein
MRRFDCWVIQFDIFGYSPVVVVELGTDITLVEQMGREVMADRFGTSGSKNLVLEKITRHQEVYLNV